ncbi:beta-ketoacyl synthase chain length factor [Shewanella sp. YIC-542]|uniref:beta-ketoacyl synthase chain length factor n=1 Tax=Shewanella mytili TaxID=3377111 RepID=UPI00398EF10B
MQLTFSLLRWGAWAPDYQQPQDWQHWPAVTAAPSSPSPKLPQVPAMQKRRFSHLTKMMLEAALQTRAPAQCRSVFASRHGELHRTATLLADVLQQQPLSPMGFSQSVHNTASGVFGIVTQNQAATTSIAAGEHSLSQAMMESWGLLTEDPAPLLLVFGDEPVPEVYQSFTNEPEYPLALALLLAPTTQEGMARITLTPCRPDSTPLRYGQLLHALASQMPLSGHLAGMHWQLTVEKPHGDTQ